MKKKLTSILLTAMLAVGLTGCQTSNQITTESETAVSSEQAAVSETTAAAETSESDSEGVTETAAKVPAPQTKDAPLSIAYVNAGMNTYYSLVLNGMKEEIERYGGDEVATIDVYSPTSSSKMVEEQITFLETLLQDDSLDVLCFSTHNDTEFIPYLKQFAEKGVSVYLFNMPSQDVSNEYYVSLVSYDFYEAGKVIGEWVKENVEGEIKMLYLEGQEGTHNTIRTEGFMEGIEGADNIEIVVSQPADWTRQGGQEVTENALQSNPEINLVYGPYDEMPLGAIVALKDAGKLDTTTVVGYDCTEDGYNAILAGDMAASVNTDAKQMGTNLIDTIIAHDMEGQEVPRAVYNTLTVIDSTNTDLIPSDNYSYTEREKSKDIAEEMAALAESGAEASAEVESVEEETAAATETAVVATNSAVAPQQKDFPLHIAYVNAGMNTYYSLVLNGMKEEVERYGGEEVATIDVYSPTSSSKMVEEQITFLETLLQDDSLDVLCFSTHNDTEFIPYLKKFAEKGVSVYLFNMPSQDVSNEYYVSLVSYNFYEAGKVIGEWIKENVEGDIKMLYLEGQEGTHNTIRTEGFMEGIEGADNIEIVVSQPANWTRQGGQEVTENALQSNPEINLVYGPYDEMPLGAIVALKDAGKLDTTTVVGYDCTEDGYNAIVSGDMAASVNTDAKQMGTNLIDTIFAHDLEGKEVPREVYNVLTVVDSTNTDTVPSDNYSYTEREKSKEIER